MYTAEYCGFCRRAKALLESKGVGWHEIHVDHDAAKRLEMVERTGRRTVPQIYINNAHVGGYDDIYALERQGELDSLLQTDGKSSAA